MYQGNAKRTGEASDTVFAAKVLVCVGVNLGNVDLVFGLRESVRDLLVSGREFLEIELVLLTGCNGISNALCSDR